MTKRKPKSMLLGGTLKLDLSEIASRIIDEHGELVAEGYKLKTPVTVTVRRDSTLTLPVVYIKRVAATRGFGKRGWYIETSLGRMFGVGPAEEPAS